MISLKKIAHKEHFDIDHRSSLKEAMALMHQNRSGCVVLVDGNVPVAILTESDIVNALSGSIDLGADAYGYATASVITANENRPIDFAFDFLSAHDIRRIVLVDEDEHYAGVVLQEDLFDYLEEDVYKVDLKISHIIEANQQITAISKDASIEEALTLMQNYHIGSVVVVDESAPVGIITEKDILKLTYLEVDRHRRVAAYMSKPVISIDKEALVADVIDLMQMKQIRRILVTEADNRVVALLTNREILNHIKGNYTRILQIKIRHAQEIMDFLPEAIVEIFDTEEHQAIHWMNRKAKEIFGEKLIDKEPSSIFVEDDWNRIYTHFDEAASIVNKTVQIRNATYEISGTLSKNLNSRFIKLIFKDVTEHENAKTRLQREIDREIGKRLENEYLLMQQSKLATMGEMIGHIAHQWRQPLAQLGGIFMNLEAAYAFNELTPEYFNEKVKNGNELLKYMSHTIEDFRHFFEPNRTKELFDLSQYIQNAINIIRASLTYHQINLTFSPPKAPVYVSGYPSEFAQVILNLLDNAKDVLLEKSIKNPNISIDVVLGEKAVLVHVRDNGGGIDEAIIDRIFDSYFTTKKRKQGTGLGLYISKLIIESKIMGKIYAENGKEGAVFTIEITKQS